MEKIGFLLIIIIVVGLALGPLTYFSGIGGTEELDPAEEREERDEIYRAASTFEGEVVEIEPYVYFEGVRDDNDLDGAKEDLETVLNDTVDIEGLNYSIHGPDLVSEGWGYTIQIPVEDSSQASEIGFRLSFDLSRLYRGSVTYRKAKTYLPSNMTGETFEGEEITLFSENKTVDTNIVHSTGRGDVKIDCPEIIAGEKGWIASVPARCAQSQETYFDYGITQDLFQEKGQNKRLNTTLNVLRTEQYNAMYQYPGNITQLNLTKIEELPSEISIEGENFFNVKDHNFEEFNESINQLKEMGLSLMEQYSITEADIPDEVELEGEQYKIKPAVLDTASVRTPLNYDEEEISVEILFRILYGDIFGLRVTHTPE